MSSLVVAASVAARGLTLNLSLPEGSVTAVVGPNGAGKTTLLHLIAGLVAPTTGTVRVGDAVLSDGSRVCPPHRRRVALLTQRTSLFPHLNVLDNVAFGPQARGASRAAARARAMVELKAVGCEDFADRHAHELSGGQAQRVAIARALAGDPDVVLLDEPLAGLDIGAAAEVRHTLATRLKGRTALFVTHEVLDIWMIADLVVVIENGRAVEFGPVDQLLSRPGSSFLADLSGMNLLSGTAADDALDIGGGMLVRGIADPDQPLTAGSAGLARISPAAVSIHLRAPEGSPRNVWPAVVSTVEARGELARVRLTLGDQSLVAELTSQSVATLELGPGARVWAAVKAVQVRLYGR